MKFCQVCFHRICTFTSGKNISGFCHPWRCMTTPACCSSVIIFTTLICPFYRSVFSFCVFTAIFAHQRRRDGAVHHLNNPFFFFFCIFLPKDTVEEATRALGQTAVNRVIKMSLLSSVCHFSAHTHSRHRCCVCLWPVQYEGSAHLNTLL